MASLSSDKQGSCADETPDQTGRQEAVMEARVRDNWRNLVRLFLVEAKAMHGRKLPCEEFGGHDQHVNASHNRHGNVRELIPRPSGLHCALLTMEAAALAW